MRHQWRDRAAQLIRVAWRKKLRRTWLAVFDGPIVTHFTRAVVGDVFSVRDFARDDRPDLCRLVTRLSASCTEETRPTLLCTPFVPKTSHSAKWR